MPDATKITSLSIRIKGLVQGVGFRPFVYRLAQQYGFKGWVANQTDGVMIKIEGPPGSMAPFVEDLRYRAPVVSQIDEMEIGPDQPEGLKEFTILESRDLSDETSEISPDIAVCPDCLKDMKTQPHRIDYPFINCTHCGPRFSIIRDFPYDRAKTTMDSFTMCPCCSQEYSDIMDRRFHAQPVACADCGPHYSMHIEGKVIQDQQEILEQTARLVENGQLVAIKGIGGFHLLCNALDEKAVDRLRLIKKREGKPFAVMFRNSGVLKHYAWLSATEETALLSWRRPIVIVKSKKTLAAGISSGLDTLGAFLPYMPMHHLLFEKLDTDAIVLTSGNLAGEPVIISNDEALSTFGRLTDAVITYDREIYNRVDDSVVRLINGKESLQRRARGYVPAPVKLAFDVHAILATGAELSNCFCLGKDNRAYMSQHIGDLKNHETFAFFEETLGRFQQIFRVKPAMVVFDMHPDYLSTRFAEESGLEMVKVQHHHAHIASCMVENGLDEPVIGLAFDGTGYGTDGHIWGSEFMVCDFSNFTRYSHFDYMPVPGGDRVSEEPWRMGISLLWQAFGEDFMDMDLPLLKAIDRKILMKVVEALNKDINCPLSSGTGRLFDAVAAITGVCTHARYHAEAPVKLEAIVSEGVRDCYPYLIGDNISFLPAIKQLCDDLSSHVAPGIMAARFHNAMTEASCEVVLRISEKTGITKVVLSGGTFQNKYLSEALENKLQMNNLEVYTHSRVPCNDGGLALGQLAVAGRNR